MVKRITLAFDDDEFQEMKEFKKSLENSTSWEELLKKGVKCLRGELDAKIKSKKD